MFHRRWLALGTTVAAATMLLGCGGDSDLCEPTADTPLIAAPDSAPVPVAPAAAIIAPPVEPPAPQVTMVSAAPIIATAQPVVAEPSVPAARPASAMRKTAPPPAVAAAAPRPAAQSAPARVAAVAAPAIPPSPTVAALPVPPRPAVAAIPTPASPFIPPLAAIPAIPTPASPVTPPIPAIPAISIPAIPSVAAITPSSPASAVASASSNPATGSKSTPTDEFSGKKMIGFANLGQTCYANAALKLLIHSIGPGALMSHLENISATISPEKIESVQEFVHLIRTAHTPQQSTAGVMKSFFTTLDKTDHFYLGKIIGQAQGTSYFYVAMHGLFEIEKINNGDFSLIRQTTGTNGARRIEQQSDILHILLPDADDMNLQALVNTYSRKADARSTCQYQFQTTDEKALKTVNFMVGPGVGSKTDQLNFNDTVTIPVYNKTSGKKFIATLEAKAIVFPKSSQPGVTHYVSYLKYDGKGFSLHNDGNVADGVEIKENNYPELISFSVIKMEAAS